MVPHQTAVNDRIKMIECNSSCSSKEHQQRTGWILCATAKWLDRIDCFASRQLFFLKCTGETVVTRCHVPECLVFPLYSLAQTMGTTSQLLFGLTYSSRLEGGLTVYLPRSSEDTEILGTKTRLNLPEFKLLPTLGVDVLSFHKEILKVWEFALEICIVTKMH